MKNIDLRQIATWVKSNLGLVYTFGSLLYCLKKLSMDIIRDYNRDPIRTTIEMQRHHRDIWLHPSRDLLQIDIFHLEFLSRHRVIFLEHKERVESPESVLRKKSEHIAKVSRIRTEFRENTLKEHLVSLCQPVPQTPPPEERRIQTIITFWSLFEKLWAQT